MPGNLLILRGLEAKAAGNAGNPPWPAGHQHDLFDGIRKADASTLRNEGDFSGDGGGGKRMRGRPRRDASALRLKVADEEFEKGGFTAAIGADDAENWPGLHASDTPLMAIRVP